MDKFQNIETWDKVQTKFKSEILPTIENHHFKLWIGSINNFQKHPSFDSAAVFEDKIVAYVDIIGTVIDQFSYEKADLYVCNVSRHI